MVEPRRANQFGGGYIPDWTEDDYTKLYLDSLLGEPTCEECGLELDEDGDCPYCSKGFPRPLEG